MDSSAVLCSNDDRTILYAPHSTVRVLLAAPSQPQELHLTASGAFAVLLLFTPAPHVYPNPEVTSYVAYYCPAGNAPERQPQQAAAGATNLCDGAHTPRRLQVMLADIVKSTRTPSSLY